mgnify:FL=1
MLNCPKCGSKKVRKNGKNRGTQRMICCECGKTFPSEPKRISKETKQKALMMYLNNVGIRKIALIFNVSPTSVLRWIKNAHKLLMELIKNFNPLSHDKADIIELDEIYTYVKKRKKEQSYGLLILEDKCALLHIQ